MVIEAHRRALRDLPCASRRFSIHNLSRQQSGRETPLRQPRPASPGRRWAIIAEYADDTILAGAGAGIVDRAAPDHIRSCRQCTANPPKPSNLALWLCLRQVRCVVRHSLDRYLGPVPVALCLSGILFASAVGM